MKISPNKLTQKQITGSSGEEEACKYLLKEGYQILDRNYRKKWGELDIIAQKDGIIHFVEVKTVTRESIPDGKVDWYDPEENIHPWKRKRLARALQSYILEKKLWDTDWQCDAISVYMDRVGLVLKIEVLPDIIL